MECKDIVNEIDMKYLGGLINKNLVNFYMKVKEHWNKYSDESIKWSEFFKYFIENVQPSGENLRDLFSYPMEFKFKNCDVDDVALIAEDTYYFSNIEEAVIDSNILYILPNAFNNATIGKLIIKPKEALFYSHCFNRCKIDKIELWLDDESYLTDGMFTDCKINDIEIYSLPRNKSNYAMFLKSDVKSINFNYNANRYDVEIFDNNMVDWYIWDLEIPQLKIKGQLVEAMDAKLMKMIKNVGADEIDRDKYSNRLKVDYQKAGCEKIPKAFVKNVIADFISEPIDDGVDRLYIIDNTDGDVYTFKHVGFRRTDRYGTKVLKNKQPFDNIIEGFVLDLDRYWNLLEKHDCEVYSCEIPYNTNETTKYSKYAEKINIDAFYELLNSLDTLTDDDIKNIMSIYDNDGKYDSGNKWVSYGNYNQRVVSDLRNAGYTKLADMVNYYQTDDNYKKYIDKRIEVRKLFNEAEDLKQQLQSIDDELKNYNKGKFILDTVDEIEELKDKYNRSLTRLNLFNVGEVGKYYDDIIRIDNKLAKVNSDLKNEVAKLKEIQ